MPSLLYAFIGSYPTKFLELDTTWQNRYFWEGLSLFPRLVVARAGRVTLYLVPKKCSHSLFSKVFSCFQLVNLSAAVKIIVGLCLWNFQFFNTVPAVFNFSLFEHYSTKIMTRVVFCQMALFLKAEHYFILLILSVVVAFIANIWELRKSMLLDHKFIDTRLDLLFLNFSCKKWSVYMILLWLWWLDTVRGTVVLSLTQYSTRYWSAYLVQYRIAYCSDFDT